MGRKGGRYPRAHTVIKSNEGPYRSYKDENKMDAWYKNINWKRFSGILCIAAIFGISFGGIHWSCTRGTEYGQIQQKLDQEAARDAKEGPCVEVAIDSDTVTTLTCPNKLHRLEWAGDWGVCKCPVLEKTK